MHLKVLPRAHGYVTNQNLPIKGAFYCSPDESAGACDRKVLQESTVPAQSMAHLLQSLGLIGRSGLGMFRVSSVRVPRQGFTELQTFASQVSFLASLLSI